MQRRIFAILISLAFLATALGAIQLFHHCDSHHGGEQCQVCYWLAVGLAMAVLLAAAIWIEDRQLVKRLPVTHDVVAFGGRPRSASSRAPPSAF